MNEREASLRKREGEAAEAAVVAAAAVKALEERSVELERAIARLKERELSLSLFSERIVCVLLSLSLSSLAASLSLSKAREQAAHEIEVELAKREALATRKALSLMSSSTLSIIWSSSSPALKGAEVTALLQARGAIEQRDQHHRLSTQTDAEAEALSLSLSRRASSPLQSSRRVRSSIRLVSRAALSPPPLSLTSTISSLLSLTADEQHTTTPAVAAAPALCCDPLGGWLASAPP